MHRPGVITALLLILALAFNSGCDTLNVMNRPGGAVVIQSVTITPETSWNADETATVSVDWTGTPPFTISIDVGTDESVLAGTTATLPYTWDFIMEEGTSFTYTVTVTDVNGTDTETGTYGPVDEPLNADPTIESADYTNGVLTVTVADVEGDDVTVTVTDITGLSVDTNTQTVVGGNGAATFIWSAEDIFSGGSGTTTVTAWDATHAGAPATEDVFIYTYYPDPELPEGQLGAIPLQSMATVGETVTVVVATADFPAAAAFNFMSSVSITFEDGGEYVHDTFNIGSVGGEEYEIDGIWATMDPVPTSFFVFDEMMVQAADVTADPSLDFLLFNITPIGAGEVTNGGELFNFGISFDHAGVYHLGFLEFQDVKRTYYRDREAVEYYWTDIDNELEVNTTITVTE